MLNYIALYIRLFWLVFIAVLALTIVLCIGRKKFKKWEKIIAVFMAVALLVLGSFSTMNALISPDIRTIDGIFQSKISEAASLSPFQMEYCFLSNGQKVYLDLDAISKRSIFDKELSKGKSYIVSYEADTNLIVAIQEK